MREDQFRTAFVRALENNGFSDEKQRSVIDRISLFHEYYQLLTEENKKQNLTAVEGYEDVIERHFIDSLLAFKLDLIDPDSVLIDVGSGAGFPGVPLAICLEDRSFDLLEPTMKRADFLSRLVEKIGLKNCSVINSRAEIVGRDERYRQRYDHALSRAVASMNVLCELCLPLVRTGGKMLAYKSVSVKEELNDTDGPLAILGGGPPVIYGDGFRNIVSVPKLTETPSGYPRRNGIPQKRPLE